MYRFRLHGVAHHAVGIKGHKGFCGADPVLIKDAQAEVDKLRTQQDGDIKWLAKHHK